VEEPTGKAKGGLARAESLTPERRKEIALAAAAAKKEKASIQRATHGSADHPLKIGEAELPCYVLEDGTRVLSQSGLIKALGMSRGSAGGAAGGDRLVSFAGTKGIISFINNDLMNAINNPIKFFHSGGGGVTLGYQATMLADICDAVLAARQAEALHPQQAHIAKQCEILVRGFARVGIIALVDEATGYQKDRARDALAKILEAFVAKEIQPYLKAFPADYYEQLFRLYGYTYPPENKRPQWRPVFFGKITNEVVYSRLAPDLLPELKKAASKAERKAKLHQWLTQDIGHPKLKDHLVSIVTLLKISKTPEEFRAYVNAVHPRYGDTALLDFTAPPNAS
jgi:P63C domain